MTSLCRFRNVIMVLTLLQFFTFLSFFKAFFPSRVPPKTKKILISGETLDYSGDYRIVRFYKSDGISPDYNFNDISLATQCSVNHLHHLVELLDRWDGPVSCAVFAPNVDASYTDDSISLLRRCFPKIRKHVTFHLVYPTTQVGDLALVGSWSDLSCDELLAKLRGYGYQNYDVGISFPHNVLRNAARSGVITQYVLLVDIDVMPNTCLRHQFTDFARRHNLFDQSVKDTSAYVVPVFEVKEGLEFPKEKKDLLRGVSEGTVRPFHNETCWWCHKAEDFDKWKNVPEAMIVPYDVTGGSDATRNLPLLQSDELEVAFNADWDKSWEPFYIARRGIPEYDERFKQYGFDRIQQICEMHVAGYNFAVLNKAFLTHHGWKVAGKFYANKDSDNAQNWILFNYHFKDDLSKKYKTNRTCSPIEQWNPRNKKGMPRAGRGQIANKLNGKYDVSVSIRHAKLSWEQNPAN